MSSAIQIYLAGFDAFENTTFESFFRLATRRDPGYEVCASLGGADLLIINSSNRDALLQALRDKRPDQRVLLIGETSERQAAGFAMQPRPVRFMAVVTAVDALMAAPGASPAGATALPPGAAPRMPQRPDFAATEPFVPLQAMPEAPQQPTPRTPPPEFAATQPFAPLEVFRDTGSAPPNGFEPTQAFMELPSPSATPAIVMPMPARREDLITADSLASYRRPVGPPPSPAAEPAALRAPASAPASAPPPSDFQATGTFLGIGSSSAGSNPHAIEDVLVVDDSDVTLKYMQNRLDRLGFRVSVARSGEEALAAVPNRAYRFVFMDVIMGGMDGFQACRAIKKRDYAGGKAPVVIMLSSQGGVFSKMRGSLAGADAYLTKPLNEADLRKALARFVELPATSYDATRREASR